MRLILMQRNHTQKGFAIYAGFKNIKKGRLRTLNEKMRNEPRLDVRIVLTRWNCGKEYSDVPLNQRPYLCDCGGYVVSPKRIIREAVDKEKVGTEEWWHKYFGAEWTEVEGDGNE